MNRTLPVGVVFLLLIWTVLVLIPIGISNVPIEQMVSEMMVFLPVFILVVWVVIGLSMEK